jgi:hypothetical protein
MALVHKIAAAAAAIIVSLTSCAADTDSIEETSDARSDDELAEAGQDADLGSAAQALLGTHHVCNVTGGKVWRDALLIPSTQFWGPAACQAYCRLIGGTTVQLTCMTSGSMSSGGMTSTCSPGSAPPGLPPAACW